MAPKQDLRSALKNWIPRLLAAQRDNLNEADTLARITKVFEEVLGYDPLEEISREAQLKGKYVDLVIKIDGAIRLLVEAKAASVQLRDRHIEQAEGYAARNNYRWVLLTNGVVWILYHLTFEQGIEFERAFSVDLTTDPLEPAAERLALLSRDSIRGKGLEKFWERFTALNPKVVGKCLFHPEVLARIRREIRRELGFSADPEDLAAVVRSMLSPEAREAIGRQPLIARRPKASRPHPPGDGSSETSGKRAPRKPPPPQGTILRREYKGREHLVTVTPSGFEYEGKNYTSLSAIAMKITGAKAISGPRFFGIA